MTAFQPISEAARTWSDDNRKISDFIPGPVLPPGGVVGQFQYTLQCHHCCLLLSLFDNTSSSRRQILAIMCRYNNVIHKTGSTSQCRQTVRGGPSHGHLGNVHKRLAEIGRAIPEICWMSDRQTISQDHHNSRTDFLPGRVRPNNLSGTDKVPT